jgi:hypothetical protein
MCNMPGGGHGPGHGPGHGHGGGHHGSGCCTSTHGMGHHGCCQGGGWRRFVSPAEKLEHLHDYLDQLKKEMAGVEAMIHDLKGK